MPTASVWLRVPVTLDMQITLPFAAHGGNYLLLHELTSNRVSVDYLRGHFYLKRTHAAKVIYGLAARGYEVHVTQDGYRRITCVAACWNANPDNAFDCECGCAGMNHGSGQPLSHEVNSELSVDGEYTRQQYVVSSHL